MVAGGGAERSAQTVRAQGAAFPAASNRCRTAPRHQTRRLQISGYIYQSEGVDTNTVCLNNGGKAPYQLDPTGLVVTPPGTILVGPVFNPTVYQLVGPNGPVGNPVDSCPAAAAPAPPPPPPPPTPAEVWSATPLPTPTFQFNPSALGLTQLPTWFWLTGINGPVNATVTIRGYRVVTTAHPEAYYWSFGDGTRAVSSSPGSDAVPSTTHTYTTKGLYTVVVIVGWGGQYTFAGNGVAAQTVQLGTVDGPADDAGYGVQEVRSVGVAP